MSTTTEVHTGPLAPVHVSPYEGGGTRTHDLGIKSRKLGIRPRSAVLS
jgi:hypothetical protein